MFTLKEKMELGMYGALVVACGIFAMGCWAQSKFYEGQVKGYDRFRDTLNASLAACTSDEERSAVFRSYGIIK